MFFKDNNGISKEFTTFNFRYKDGYNKCLYNVQNCFQIYTVVGYINKTW